MEELLERTRKSHSDAIERMDAAVEALAQAEDSISEAELEELTAAVDAAEAEVVRHRADVQRLERVKEAREGAPKLSTPEPVSVKEEESPYRPDANASFFRDLVYANTDPNAAERLRRNQSEAIGRMSPQDQRVVTSSAGGGGFVPPIYLADLWAELARPGRKFVDKMPTAPFPPDGLTVTIPKVSTGVTEASQQENGSVSSTDISTTTVTAPMVTVAGQNDISRQVLERSFPGLDMVIFRDLQHAYDAELDRQLIVGSGSSGQHLGIRNVSSVNTVTDNNAASGTQQLKDIYNAIQLVASNRFLDPDMIVTTPARAAWLAAQVSNNFPILQQGGLGPGSFAAGTQDGGFAGTIAGLPVLTDPNVPSNLGSGTNQDEIYVLHTKDFVLMEGPVRQATYEEVLSGNLAVRLQLFAYGFWVPNRYPKSISIIGGTALSTPGF